MFRRDFDQTDSIETMQKQLGLGPGVELPLGAKPVTSREAVARRILSDREEEFVDLHKIKYVLLDLHVLLNLHKIKYVLLDLHKIKYVLLDTVRSA